MTTPAPGIGIQNNFSPGRIPDEIEVRYSDWLNAKDIGIAVGLVTDLFLEEILVLEVGVWTGGWSISFLKSAGLSVAVYGIDPFPGHPEKKIELRENIKAEGFSERFTLYDSWEQALKTSGAARYAMVHIDGRHTETAVFQDLRMASYCLEEGAIIVVDDYANPLFPGVSAGLHRFLLEFEFRPFLVTEGKMYVCRKSDAMRLWNVSKRLLNESGRIDWAEHYREPGLRPEGVQQTDVLGQPVLLALGRHRLAKASLSVQNPQNRPKKMIALFAPPVLVSLWTFAVKKIKGARTQWGGD